VWEDEHGFGKEPIDLKNINKDKIKDRKSEGYLREHRLYIIGAGDYLVYGTWDDGISYELRRVEDDEDTYIPTTTININCFEGSAEDVQGTLDEPNLLCKKRINRLVGAKLEDTGDDGKRNSWMLDSSIEENSEVRVKVEKYDDTGKVVEEEYINSGGDKKELFSKDSGDGAIKGMITFDVGMIRLNFSTESVSNQDNIYVTFIPAKKEKDYRVIIIKPEDCKIDAEGHVISTTLNEALQEGSKIVIEVIRNGVRSALFENAYRSYNSDGTLKSEDCFKNRLYRQDRTYDTNATGDTVETFQCEEIDFSIGYIPFTATSIAYYETAYLTGFDYMLLRY
jgi:hypothetical protein